ncbi:YhcN/YlaJ family sporulation lipoprotein [Paenibacillus allorhizosphaerae]|uniref:Sporulation protein n=1 Tax=Paenibacillus allorhizosphaerae TaxID=2849866 RepID=A0ABM8VEQ3_9BACL|nr:YhcN/YlaJ family sporulation lipoprotein [Paenibacillus allorhizosphaerae]CAG7629708.1 hypothetical protein PAECIP111802_01581 [Paenibacillus allorhizosphaerae]
MNIAKRRKCRLLLAISIGCMLTAAGCGGNRPQASRPGGGMEDYRQQALFDRDSRNNENPSLGVKERWVGEQNQKQTDEAGNRYPLDPNNPLLSKTIKFDPQVAQKLRSLPGIQSAQVLVTEANAYVAVVLDGHNPDAEASPEVTNYPVHSKGGMGLFGTGSKPDRISWTEHGGLSTEAATDIRKQTQAFSQKSFKQVFVSANPNFVQRVQFYAKEEKEKGNLYDYLNEFNTMVQHVFPVDGNTRK